MNKCKKYRLLAEMTQKEAAKELGKSVTSISFYETGLHKLPIAVAKQMAVLYGCKWTDFYGDDNDGSNPNRKRCSKAV